MFFVFRSMAKHLRKVQMAARAEAEAAAKAKAAFGDTSAGMGAETGARLMPGAPTELAGQS